jgi:uncharacterized membrane protein
MFWRVCCSNSSAHPWQIVKLAKKRARLLNFVQINICWRNNFGRCWEKNWGVSISNWFTLCLILMWMWVRVTSLTLFLFLSLSHTRMSGSSQDYLSAPDLLNRYILDMSHWSVGHLRVSLSSFLCPGMG